jgi:hypothetical protein
MSSLNRNADISSEYVQISIIHISYVVVGYMKASYQFLGQLRDGHGGQKDIARRLQHGPQDFQLHPIHHGFEIHNQAISAAGASKKTENSV